MTDRTRRQDQRHGPQSSDGRVPSDTADDRGLERDRRSFSGDREHDELGSEMEDERAVEDGDDLRMDDGLGDPNRHDL
jgi:hypothetical protein